MRWQARGGVKVVHLQGFCLAHAGCGAFADAAIVATVAAVAVAAAAAA
jgi:hypothetical protein